MFSPQAPAVHRFFCSPSAVVEEYFLSTAFGFLFAAQEAIWLSFGSTDEDIHPTFQQKDTQWNTFLQFLVNLAPHTHIWKFSAQMLYDRAPYDRILSHMKGAYYHMI